MQIVFRESGEMHPAGHPAPSGVTAAGPAGAPAVARNEWTSSVFYPTIGPRIAVFLVVSVFFANFLSTRIHLMGSRASMSTTFATSPKEKMHHPQQWIVNPCFVRSTQNTVKP
jgi:hypothetical protein